MIPIKKLEVKREHHYVQVDYLKRWSEDKINIWHNTKNNKVCCGGIRSIAKERDFYRLNKINGAQIRIMRLFISEFSEYAKIQFDNIINTILLIQEFDEKEELLPEDERLTRALTALKANLIEDEHRDQESQAKPIIDRIASSHDRSALDSKENLFAISIYVGHQITRTKSYRDSWKKYSSNWIKSLSNASNENINKIKDLDDCWWLVSHITGLNAGWNMYARSKETNQCILINETEQSFITSDNPAINAYPNTFRNNNSIEADEYDMLIALSPSVAYVSSGSRIFPNGLSILHDISKVEEINVKIASQSHINIFGNKKDDVLKYRKLIGAARNQQ